MYYQTPYHHALHCQTVLSAGRCPNAQFDQALVQLSSRSNMTMVGASDAGVTCGNGLLRLVASLFSHA